MLFNKSVFFKKLEFSQTKIKLEKINIPYNYSYKHK